MRLINFEKAMGAFTFGQQQDFIIYLTTLKRSGYTIEDAIKYVKIKQRKNIKLTKNKNTQKSCTKCNGIMLLYSVNDSANTQTGDPKDKSVWLCQSKNCMHTIYNTQTVEEIISKKR